MPTTVSHYLIVPVPSWGHVRPMCQFALRLLDANDKAVVTILSAPHLFAKTQSEVADRVKGQEENPKIRVVSTPQSASSNPVELIGAYIASYCDAYKTLHEEKGIMCAATGVTYHPTSAPVAVIIDSFLSPALHATRALTGTSVPVFVFATGSALHIIRSWGPEHLGGRGNFIPGVEAQAASTGEDKNVLGTKTYRTTTGAVVNLPGVPIMYDHEFFPQEMPLMPHVFVVMKSGHDFFAHCDGVLLSSAYSIETKAIEGIKSWFAETNRSVYSVGPLLPASYWAAMQSDQGSVDVPAFLDDMQAKHGEKSVILVSFGSQFWPPVHEYVEELINILIEKQFPFILCHPSTSAKITPEIIDKVSHSGIGMLSPWVPQHYVLTHPATGWFLTHGGQGSVTESLGRGIPLICWPIDGDQPVTSVDLAHHLHVAFELVEVRSGQGLKPIHRFGGRAPEGTRAAVAREIRTVIDAARGEPGREIRKNAEAFKDALKSSWDEEGFAARDLKAFIEKTQV